MIEERLKAQLVVMREALEPMADRLTNIVDAYEFETNEDYEGLDTLRDWVHSAVNKLRDLTDSP